MLAVYGSTSHQSACNSCRLSVSLCMLLCAGSINHTVRCCSFWHAVLLPAPVSRCAFGTIRQVKPSLHTLLHCCGCMTPVNPLCCSTCLLTLHSLISMYCLHQAPSLATCTCSHTEMDDHSCIHHSYTCTADAGFCKVHRPSRACKAPMPSKLHMILHST